jgi:hypothetical protein
MGGGHEFREKEQISPIYIFVKKNQKKMITRRIDIIIALIEIIIFDFSSLVRA